MSNRMFLACRHCPTKSESYALGDRTGAGYQTQSDAKSLQKWLDAHRHCGGDLDHFTSHSTGRRITTRSQRASRTG